MENGENKEYQYFGRQFTAAEVLAMLQAGESLAGASLTDLDLDGAQMAGARMPGAVFLRTSLEGACLDNADLTSAVIDSASFRGATFRGADLSGSIITNSDGNGADFSGANLQNCHFHAEEVLGKAPGELGFPDIDSGSNLAELDLSPASIGLSEADFVPGFCSLESAVFRDADLTKVTLGAITRGDWRARQSSQTLFRRRNCTCPGCSALSGCGMDRRISA